MDDATRRSLLIALNTLDVSRAGIHRLAAELDTWAAPGARADAALARTLGVPLALLGRALALLSTAPEMAAQEVAAAGNLGARVLTWLDADYPTALRDGSHPPPVLYCRGSLPGKLGIAVVGARQPTPYGREVAHLFAAELAAAGLAVISGFARGVDAAAHEGAIGAAVGATVAVLGCGLAIDYPAHSRSLAARIATRGAVISELPCSWQPRNWHFPLRNRLIAALSWGTLVVEAAPRSGSMITVRHTLDLGREVWAVPGRLFDEQALGPNSLIRDGAVLVQHPRQILEALPAGALDPARRTVGAQPPRPPSDPLLAALTPGDPLTAEALAERLGWRIDRVLAHLLELELADAVARLPGSLYTRRAVAGDLAVDAPPSASTRGMSAP
jgi:DNA processing protein